MDTERVLGTTALQLAGCIKEASDITVVTNGYLACKHFSDKGLRVFSTGGRLLANSLAFVGDSARKSVEGYNADALVILPRLKDIAKKLYYALRL